MSVSVETVENLVALIVIAFVVYLSVFKALTRNTPVHAIAALVKWFIPTKAAHITIENNRALVSAAKMLTLPVHAITGQWRVQAVYFSEDTCKPLELITHQQAGMTYVVGLPVSPIQLNCKSTMVTLRPHDYSRRPTALRFNDATPIILTPPRP